MTTYRKNIGKWLAYFCGLLAVIVAERAIFCFLPFGGKAAGVCPVLIPVAVACVALLEGAEGGGVFGLVSGFVWFCLSPEGGAVYIFTMTACGVLAGGAADRLFNGSLVSAMLWSLLCVGLSELVVLVYLLAVGRAAPSALLSVIVPECVYSTLLSPAIYYMMRAIRGRLGVY